MAITDLFSAPGSQSTKFPLPGGIQNFNPLIMIPNARGYLDTLANKFILKPANAKGINGFVFDYAGETTVHLQAEITDHYSEENTFTNDHAALKPARIVLRGYVAELAVTPNSGVLGALASLQSKLTTLPAILGKYTPAIVPKIAALTSKATNVVNTIDTDISRVQNLAGLIVGSQPASTKQEKAYQQLSSMWSTNQVFTLETPFAYFQSMMIESITITQDETTKEWSELSVTVKEVRFIDNPSDVGMGTTLSDQANASRSVFQSQGPTNNGKVQGVISPISNIVNPFTSGFK